MRHSAIAPHPHILCQSYYRHSTLLSSDFAFFIINNFHLAGGLHKDNFSKELFPPLSFNSLFSRYFFILHSATSSNLHFQFLFSLPVSFHRLISIQGDSGHFPEWLDVNFHVLLRLLLGTREQSRAKHQQLGEHNGSGRNLGGKEITCHGRLGSTSAAKCQPEVIDYPFASMYAV